MNGTFDVREERRGDRKGIHDVHLLAFGSEAEAKLVDRLRRNGLIVISLVAVDGHQVIGHALFSQLPIERVSSDIQAAALAPVGVHPDRQREGIGRALIQRGIEHCRKRGTAAVLVLGSPAYYGRFGFSAQLAAGLETRYAGPAYMGLEFIPGILTGGGIVHYSRAFELVE